MRATLSAAAVLRARLPREPQKSPITPPLWAASEIARAEIAEKIQLLLLFQNYPSMRAVVLSSAGKSLRIFAAQTEWTLLDNAQGSRKQW